MIRALSLISLISLISLGATGCPKPKPQPNGKPRGPDVATLEGRLELPPVAATRSALAQLEKLAAQGNPRARWSRLRYLFDLYDFARLTGETPARTLLLRALGGTGAEPRGARATGLVQDRLSAALLAFFKFPTPASPSPLSHKQMEVQRREALVLAGLLRSDRRLGSDPKTLPARLKLLKAARTGPVASAAKLRLYALCAQAFRVAARAAPPRRPFVLNHCLHVLYDFDPSPHLSAVGAPPQPPWTAYRDRLQQLLDDAASGPRMAALVGLRTELDRRFYRRNAARLPVLLHEHIRDLPRLTGGQPYRGASALVLRTDQLLLGGRTVVRPRKRHFRVALTEAYFAGNRHTRITLFPVASLPMGQVAPVLERAAATGFYTVGFGGVVASPSRVGYWRHARGAKPLRAREVGLSLAPISAAAASLKSLAPAQLGWDRTCARHKLGVLLAPREATPYGPDGRLSPLSSPQSTAQAVQLALSRLRSAFPTACAVRIAADPKLTYGDFLAAMATLRSNPGWRWFGYDRPPGKPAANTTFANRVTTRLAAKVKLQRWPRRLRASSADLIRRMRPCYLQALDKAPTRWGRLEAHSAPDKTLVSQLKGTNPEELSLNNCIARAIDAWRKHHSVDIPLRFRIQLKP